jgi:hypothetical protein
MNYRQLYWRAGNEKIKKSKKETHELLNKEVERKKESIALNNIHNNSMYNNNAMHNINMLNFRESIEINIENKTNNRDLLEKRLSGREKMHNGKGNPYLRCDKYLEDLSNESNFLRPKNTNFIEESDNPLNKVD